MKLNVLLVRRLFHSVLECNNDVELQAVKMNKTNLITGKKKINRPRKTSESQRKRFESNSSNSDLDCSIDTTLTEGIDFEDLVELPTKKVIKVHLFNY